MTLAQAVAAAKNESRKNNGLTLVVVYAPLELAEYEDHYGYCPADAKDVLYRHGEVIATVTEKPSPND